jgi:hypothetical protein
VQLTTLRARAVGAALLLLLTGHAAFGQEHGSSLDANVALDYGQYADTDHVFVETPSLRGQVTNPTAGWRVDGQYLVDVVSAASVDIVSTASRRWNEVRNEGSLQGAYKPKNLGVQASGSVSDEPDYLSWSLGAAVNQDLADRSVTWQLGYVHVHDIAGRTGTPFSVFSHVIDRNAISGSLTFILSRSALATVVGDAIFDSGDDSKPYRYIPLFAPGTAVPQGASVDLVNALRTSARPLEQLPLSRQRYALTGRLAYRFGLATLRLSERLYADSWQMLATTTDARYLFDLSQRIEMGPHARAHAQSDVDFWQRAYVLGPGYQVPALRTGSRELGPLVNLTAGWTARIRVGAIPAPTAWFLGFDLDVTSTRYLDDLYLTQRTSVLGAVSLDADF